MSLFGSFYEVPPHSPPLHCNVSCCALRRRLSQRLNNREAPRGSAYAIKEAEREKRKRIPGPLMTNRLDYAIAHQDWTVEDWKRVIFSDETKANRLGSDGRKWAWKLPGEDRKSVV